MASVYLITNTVNGKQYVGFTSQPMRHRWAQHVFGAKHDPSQVLHTAMAKYGQENFTLVVMYEGLSVPFALALETAAIQSLGTLAPGGYNLTTGGEHHTLTDEGKARLSDVLRKRRHSPETKALMSSQRKGKKKTPEHRANIGAAHRRNEHLVPEALKLLGSGLSQRKVAALLGVSQPVVGRWHRAHKGRG